MNPLLLVDTFVTACLVWFAISILATAWIDWSVPIADHDHAWSSWLGGNYSFQYLGKPPSMFQLGLLLIGSFMASARRSINPMVLATLLVFAVPGVTSQDSMIRIGVIAGGVKIGCYLPDTQECKQMLRISGKPAPSMYAPKTDEEEVRMRAEWYSEKIKPHEVSGVLSLPGVYFLISPLYAFRTAEINQIIQQQRAAVMSYRAGTFAKL